jgi:hypothetical protein
MSLSLLALQWTGLTVAVTVALVLAVVLLVPYLIEEIRYGKQELGPLRRFTRRGVILGPRTPTGAGDETVGTRDNPAPGQRTGQGDPYGAKAQRNGPPIKS